MVLPGCSSQISELLRAASDPTHSLDPGALGVLQTAHLPPQHPPRPHPHRQTGTGFAVRSLQWRLGGMETWTGTLEAHVVDGGGVSLRGLPLAGREHVVGGTLAVVAPPLGALGRVIGALTGSGRVGGVVLGAGPLAGAGQPHVAGQRGWTGRIRNIITTTFCTDAEPGRETFLRRAATTTVQTRL